MALKLRYDEEEGLLRSVGDAPNGIVGVDVHHNDDDGWTASFVIDGGIELAAKDKRFVKSTELARSGQTPVELAAMLQACDSPNAKGFAALMLGQALERAAVGSAVSLDSSPVRAVADLLDELRGYVFDPTLGGG